MSLRSHLLRIYGRLPAPLRRTSVRMLTPLFQVGAVCVVNRADGALLLVRHSYRKGWGFPGGLLKRGEAPVDAAAREMREEIGLTMDLDDNPHVVVDAPVRRVDVIYTARLPDGAADPEPQSAEIVDVGWFAPGNLPRLGTEAASTLVELGRVRPPGSSGPLPSAPVEDGR
ncbi:MAG: NUDIX domain-containing protein [Acidimicrobiales bacterium]